MTHRLRRYIVCPLLALTCVGVAALWVRSYRRTDVLAFFDTSAELNGLGSFRGSLMLFLSELKFSPADGVSFQHGSAPTEEFASIDDMLHDKRALKLSLAGFRVARGDISFMSPPPTYTAVTVPHWFVIGLTAVPSALWLRGVFRRRKWARQGLCRECGYDLRSTPNRCPECGAAPKPPRKAPVAAPAAVVAAVTVLCLAGPAAGTPVFHAEDLPVLKELNLKGVTLEEAFDRVRQAAGVDLVVHWPVLEAMEFERGTRVNLHLHDVRVGEALDLLLVRIGGRDVPLEWTLRDGRIVVTSTDDERSRLTRVFDLRGLIETMRRTSHEQDLPVTWLEAEDELLRFLTEHVDPDGWTDAGGSSGNSRMLWGRLVVTHQKPEVIRELEALLARLQVILSQPPPKPPLAATRPVAEEVDPPPSPLWTRKVPELDLTDTTLEKALDRLRDVTGLDVVIQSAVLEAAGVERTAPINLRLRDVTAERAFDAVLTSEVEAVVRALLGVHAVILAEARFSGSLSRASYGR